MFHFLQRIITTIEISIWTHVYHSTNPISECPKGYLGDCSQRCISPAYGEDCQSLCNCADGYYCHFANGCSQFGRNKTELQHTSISLTLPFFEEKTCAIIIGFPILTISNHKP